MDFEIIELPSNNEDSRIFEGDDWRAVISKTDFSLHLCLFCYKDGEIVKPSDDKIDYVAKNLFTKENNPIPYIKTIPFNNNTVHLWEANKKVKKAIASWCKVF
jgi:hypothetical protein